MVALPFKEEKDDPCANFNLWVGLDIKHQNGRHHGHNREKWSYKIYRSSILPQMLDFLAHLPTGVGCSVRSDYKDVETYIRKFLGHSHFKFLNSWINIDCLGGLAGVHSSKKSMFNLNHQLLGGFLVKERSFDSATPSTSSVPMIFRVQVPSRSKLPRDL